MGGPLRQVSTDRGRQAGRLTQDSLRAERNRLDDVAAGADARVEEDSELPAFLAGFYPWRRADLLEAP